MKFVEGEGKTVDEAVEKALKELGALKDEVQVEVMEEIESKGLFGFGLSKSVKVKVSLLENNESGNLKSKSKEILSRILELMDIKAEVIAKETKETVELEIRTEDAAILIGKRGQTLNSLQELITLMVNKGGVEIRKRFVLDTEDYRRRRSEVLVNLAQRSAQDVLKTRQEIELEPMIPQERYIIHSTLQDYPKIMTQSRGEGIDRRVVILPK
ncbi:MAG: RNA-binding cell elongation regulator Jag/EloR [bacterium]|nr:RNA-binding cell elongation regulator Jag/EloR [bacterium]